MLIALLLALLIALLIALLLTLLLAPRDFAAASFIFAPIESLLRAPYAQLRPYSGSIEALLRLYYG